jgi:hypothetical protein
MMLVTGLGWYQIRRRSSSLRLQSLLVVPSPVAQYPVKAEMYANHRRYGSDAGVITFVDDALVYTGFSTDFSFTKVVVKDVIPPNRNLSPYSAAPSRLTSYRILWITDNTQYELRLTPQAGIPGAAKNPEEDFCNDLYVWTTKPNSSVLNVLPPAGPRWESVMTVRRAAIVVELVASALTLGTLSWVCLEGFVSVPREVFGALVLVWLVPMPLGERSRAFDGDLSSGVGFGDRASFRALFRLAATLLRPWRWWIPIRSAFRSTRPAVEPSTWVPAKIEAPAENVVVARSS